MIINMETITTIDGDNVNMGHKFDIKQRVDENFSDFHLFCLSVVRDLINNKSCINDEPFSYNFIFDEDDEDDDVNDGEEWKEKSLEPQLPGYLQETMDVLRYMSDVIFQERNSFNKELENLLK